MEVIKKMVEIKFFKDKDLECNAWELYNLLEDLENTSAFGDMLIINDDNIKKYLEEEGIISTVIRGGAFLKPTGGNEKRKKLLDFLEKEY